MAGGPSAGCLPAGRLPGRGAASSAARRQRLVGQRPPAGQAAPGRRLRPVLRPPHGRRRRYRVPRWAPTRWAPTRWAPPTPAARLLPGRSTSSPPQCSPRPPRPPRAPWLQMRLSAGDSGRGFRLPHPAGPRSAEHAGACSAHSRSPGECRPAPFHRRGRRRRSRLLADRSRRIPSRRAALRRGRRDWTSSPAQSGRYDASAWTPTQGLHRAVSNVHESDASPASRDTIRRVRGEQ